MKTRKDTSGHYGCYPPIYGGMHQKLESLNIYTELHWTHPFDSTPTAGGVARPRSDNSAPPPCADLRIRVACGARDCSYPETTP